MCLTLEDQPIESAPISNQKSSEQITVVYTNTIHRLSFRRQSLDSTFDSAVSEDAGLLQWFIMDAYGEFHWANRSKWSEQPEQHTGVTGTSAFVPRMKHSRCSGSSEKRGRARCQESCDQTFPALASRSISRACYVRTQLFLASFAKYVPVVLCLPSAWRRMKKPSGCSCS